jgi:hypothetical protein
LSITREHAETSETTRHGDLSARRFEVALIGKTSLKSKAREDGELRLRAMRRSPCYRRLVGEGVDGSARREAGGGERHVVGENARENVLVFCARHNKQITLLD